MTGPRPQGFGWTARSFASRPHRRNRQDPEVEGSGWGLQFARTEARRLEILREDAPQGASESGMRETGASRKLARNGMRGGRPEAGGRGFCLEEALERKNPRRGEVPPVLLNCGRGETPPRDAQ